MSRNQDGAGRAPGPSLADEFPEAVALGVLLRSRGLSAGTAESCTGGLLGAALTAIPGSSAYVRGGIIAYSNGLKTGLLQVDPALIAEHGAVSEEVAAAMARGCVAAIEVDVAMAITGVAGPGAENPLKPAGLMYLAVAVGATVSVEELRGDRGREQNRAHAVRSALRLGVDALN